MLDKENLFFVASWDTAHLNDVDVESLCDDLASILRQISDLDSWHRAVEELLN